MRKVLWNKCFAKFFIQNNKQPHGERTNFIFFYLCPESRPSEH